MTVVLMAHRAFCPQLQLVPPRTRELLCKYFCQKLPTRPLAQLQMYRLDVTVPGQRSSSGSLESILSMSVANARLRIAQSLDPVVPSLARHSVSESVLYRGRGMPLVCSQSSTTQGPLDLVKSLSLANILTSILLRSRTANVTTPLFSAPARLHARERDIYPIT